MSEGSNVVFGVQRPFNVHSPRISTPFHALPFFVLSATIASGKRADPIPIPSQEIMKGSCSLIPANGVFPVCNCSRIQSRELQNNALSFKPLVSLPKQGHLSFKHSSKLLNTQPQPLGFKCQSELILSTLVDERLTASPKAPPSSEILAYELVQGALVEWNYSKQKSAREPPTAVFLHGILGGRKNWGSFARRLAKDFPSWQFLLVDLRCHGDSASITKRGPHTVASAARDVLQLVGQLKLTPRVLIGHSFGGKVALSMVDQAAKPLARPVKVWVLDATPGKVHAGGDGEDRPAELISFLSRLPKQMDSKQHVLNLLIQNGFSPDIAKWITTSLRQDSLNPGKPFSWIFDLEGISDLYNSYENTNLWRVVENVPQGVHVNFLKAERSLHRWAYEDIQRIHVAEQQAATEGAGVQMHVLEDAGHWVHADNPDGLFRILSPSFKIYC